MTSKKAALKIGCTICHLNTLLRKGKIKAKKIPSDSNHLGYRWEVSAASVRRYANKKQKGGWPRGQSR